MRGTLDVLNVIAVWVGYWTLLSGVGFLALWGVSLAHDARRRSPPVGPPRSVDVWKMGPLLNPHPHQHVTLHVDTDDVEQAWRVIGGRAS